MNRETRIDLSSTSSRESSLGEEEKQQQQQGQKLQHQQLQTPSTDPANWKEKTNSVTTSEDEVEEEEDVEDEEDNANANFVVVGGGGDEDEVVITGMKTVAEVAATATAMPAGAEQAVPRTTAELVARDVRRLKSATLDRMGKMLKIHSKSTGEKSEVAAVSASSDDTTRKQKFNSLTRMLRLSDRQEEKACSGGKSLGQIRGRSLTRILRRKVPAEGDNPPDKPDEHVRGIFSRIIGQIRGRGSKADSTTDKSLQNAKEKAMRLSAKSPSSSALADLSLETSCPIMSTRRQA